VETASAVFPVGRGILGFAGSKHSQCINFLYYTALLIPLYRGKELPNDQVDLE
jgi:hypothetical protein